MRTKTRAFVLAACGLLALPAFGQIPTLINYQGRLLDGTNLYNGTVNMRLLLYNVPSGGAQVYEDTGTVTVADGLYSTFIGDGTALGSLTTVLTNSAVYLEIIVNSTILTPRERIAAVAYAIMASGVPNGAITTPMLANNAVTSDKISDGTISNTDLAANSVTGDKIVDGSISNADHAANSIAAAQSRCQRHRREQDCQWNHLER